MNRFRSTGVTDIGLRRQNNEDNFLIDHYLDLFLVADGVGGHMAGELASAMALTCIRKIILERAEDFSDSNDVTVPDRGAAADVTIPCPSQIDMNPDRKSVLAALNYANNMLFTESQRLLSPEGRLMGTTIAGIYFHPGDDGSATIFNVGDSRLYIFRNQRLVQMTTDHSAYQQWLSKGSIGPAPSHNIIIQALGQTPNVRPSVRVENFLAGDLVLMCTDGLSDCLDRVTLTRHLANLDRNNLEAGCELLVNAALATSGADNITVLLGEFM